MKFKSIILISVLIFIYSNGFSQDAREISKKALELADFDAMEMISTLKIMIQKGKRTCPADYNRIQKIRGNNKDHHQIYFSGGCKGYRHTCI